MCRSMKHYRVNVSIRQIILINLEDQKNIASISVQFLNQARKTLNHYQLIQLEKDFILFYNYISNKGISYDSSSNVITCPV